MGTARTAHAAHRTHRARRLTWWCVWRRESLVGVQADQRVLDTLLMEKLPHVATHFERLGFTLPLITTQWFSCLFVKDLGAEVRAACVCVCSNVHV